MAGKKMFSLAEVATHNTPKDCWVIIKNRVYDVTKFMDEHPGGKKIILKVAGKDASAEFEKFHNVTETLQKYGPALLVGEIANTNKASNKEENVQSSEIFIPYGEPTWNQGWNSNFYKDSHKRLRTAMRNFVDKEIMPYAHQWDEGRAIPIGIFKKAYEAGWLPGIIGKSWPTKYAGPNIAGGVKPEEYDAFHELIIIDEVARSGSAGVCFSLLMALDVGLPPVLHFGLGNKELQERICKECLTGQKNICLAITEPGAGSDVANLSTTAVLDKDGKHYIVNGEKKWITGGTFADYFTVAVRTQEGMGGLSLLLIERGPGVTTRQMACSGAWSGGTAFVTFEDVKVPVSNLIGKENSGFKYIMHNFNHERWSLIIQALRFARVCYEEAFKYAHKRKTFGKRLIDHPVIRMKLAHMVRQLEGTQSWLEQVTHQMNTMTYEESRILGGPLALMKAHTSTVFEFCAREAAQIFGGLSYTRGGQGEKVERLLREVRGYAIPGGSEEILLDFGIRQAVRSAKL